MEESNNKIPGKGAATGSLVCGIISVAFCWFGYSAFVSVVLGIIGMILAASSKKAGYSSGARTAGFVLSLIGTILGAVFFVSCIACGSCLCASL